jgi:hypothetical protein
MWHHSWKKSLCCWDKNEKRRNESESGSENESEKRLNLRENISKQARSQTFLVVQLDEQLLPRSPKPRMPTCPLVAI